MRKVQKRQLLSIIADMHTAHIEIREAIEHKNMVLIQNMMCELQEIAISLGNTIENLVGKECTTISYLEKYCEILYQLLQKIQSNFVSPYKAQKVLGKALQTIENSIKNDINVRKEIVFFPYKASMWDSLESLYLDLKEDKRNDVYCVPIPYYELNSDRSFGQMYYEGSEYPTNIEVIDYKSYNFEERCPDEIYIHNPYDSWNRVTSVEPRFYASNLKKYTDKLVYSPYFVLPEIDPYNQEAIDRMKHFIWTPGVIYADEVILQSNAMKQIYISQYINEVKAEGITGLNIDQEYLENKFKGTGSPKIEKILRTKKEQVDLPDEWKKVIQKENGDYKKVVLFNTGISSLLKHGMGWIHALEKALDIFKNNDENIALLWRPHPLIVNTMQSMKPEVLNDYVRIRSEYIEQGWGILDESSDLHRAIALSDAYYGNQSSIVPLYRAVNKPVMVQLIP